MIIGVFENVQDAEMTIGNLMEAEYLPQQVSVVMEKTMNLQDVFGVSGPYTGPWTEQLADSLRHWQITQHSIDTYFDIVAHKGGVLLIVSNESVPEKTTQQFFVDNNAQLIQSIHL